MKKIFSVFLSFILIAVMFAGCSSSGKSTHISYPFSGDIDSYDPQIAAKSDEYLFIENVFEGLVRVDDDGTVRAGVAEKWQTSRDGLTYTFNLRKGAKWHISDEIKERMGDDYNPEITADDFVFALQRAAMKSTDSPLYSTISCIKNAPSVHSGSKSASSLGVKAVDDYTLQITLSTKNSGFLQTMSTAVAMPCNREFFNETKGRYGLESKYSLFNGQFYLSYRLDTSFILNKNDDYVGENPAKLDSVTLYVNEDSQNIYEKLVKGTYDAAFIDGTSTKDLSSKNKMTVTPYNDTTWAIIFNCNDEFFADSYIRQAFCLGLSKADVSSVNYLETATGMVPPSCTIGDTSYRKLAKSAMNKQDIDKSAELWTQGLKATEAEDKEITILTTTAMADVLKESLQGIQSGIGKITSYTNYNGQSVNISTTFKIETVEENELENKVTSGDYQIALYPFEAKKASPVAYLADYANDSFYTGLTASSFKTTLAKAENNKGNNITDLYYDCEKSLIESYTVYPLFFESSYYAENYGVKNIQFHPGSGRVDFTNATVEN